MSKATPAINGAKAPVPFSAKWNAAKYTPSCRVPLRSSCSSAMSPIIDATVTDTGAIANALRNAIKTSSHISTTPLSSMMPARSSITGPVTANTQPTTPRITVHFLSSSRFRYSVSGVPAMPPRMPA